MRTVSSMRCCSICYTVLVTDERSDRRDILMFLGFVTLCGSVALTIVVARGTWSSDTWTAVGAIGSGVQAIGVISALVYAARQVRQAEASARQAREDELMDRFETVVYEELLPSLVPLWSAYQRAAVVVPRAISQYRGLNAVDPEVSPTEAFTAIDDLQTASRQSARARARAFRTLARLGVRSQEIADMETDRRRRVVTALANVQPIVMYDFAVRPRAKTPSFPDWTHEDMFASYEAVSLFAEKLLSRLPPES
jgi:hypothetical protein